MECGSLVRWTPLLHPPSALNLEKTGAGWTPWVTWGRGDWGSECVSCQSHEICRFHTYLCRWRHLCPRRAGHADCSRVCSLGRFAVWVGVHTSISHGGDRAAALVEGICSVCSLQLFGLAGVPCALSGGGGGVPSPSVLVAPLPVPMPPTPQWALLLFPRCLVAQYVLAVLTHRRTGGGIYAVPHLPTGVPVCCLEYLCERGVEPFYPPPPPVSKTRQHK